MKTKAVPRSWFEKGGLRLDCNPYMKGAIETEVMVEKLPFPKVKLAEVTQGHAGGIYNGPIFKRVFVDNKEHGVPFLSSSSMLKSDLTTLPLLRKKDALSSKLSYLKVKPGMTLISCSGSVGNMTYGRADMHGMWSSQDVLKVVPDEDKVLPGFIYAFLASKFGKALVTSGTYGAIIQHLEPHHISDILVPRFDNKTEVVINEKIELASQLRSKVQRLLDDATEELLCGASLDTLKSEDWHANGPDLGFAVKKIDTTTFRSINFNPRKENLFKQIKSGEHRMLSDICNGGHLGTGARFKRIDADEDHGVCLVGQKQGFLVNPKGRWISAAHAPKGIFVKDETVLIASSGTLGEKEVYCRPIFATGKWLDYAYTQHFFRVVSNDPDISGAYLFAFLRSELAFRCLRSISTGSKQQELHPKLIKEFPVPIVPKATRESIECKVRQAFAMRDKADESEAEAISLVEETIEGAS